MSHASRGAHALAVSISLLALSACSVDALLWGPDAGRVITTTDQLVALASTDEQDALACDDFAGGFGDPRAWDGLSAGEPEQFDESTSVDRPSLDATWRINLEGRAAGLPPGEAGPTDVFYREVDGELCIADVIWQVRDL